MTSDENYAPLVKKELCILRSEHNDFLKLQRIVDTAAGTQFWCIMGDPELSPGEKFLFYFTHDSTYLAAECVRVVAPQAERELREASGVPNTFANWYMIIYKRDRLAEEDECEEVVGANVVVHVVGRATPFKKLITDRNELEALIEGSDFYMGVDKTVFIVPWHAITLIEYTLIGKEAQKEVVV